MRRLGAGLIWVLAAGAAFGAVPDWKVVAQITDRWLKAEGGFHALYNLDTLEYDLTTSAANQGSLTVHWIQTAQGPFRWETTLPGSGRLVWASDGKATWLKSDRLGFGMLPPAAKPPVLRPDDIWSTCDVFEIYPERDLLADGSCDGRPCHRVMMIRRDGAHEVWSFDAATGLLDGVRIGGDKGDYAEYLFSDFRTTDGITLPWLIRARTPKIEVTALRANVIVNPDVDADTFRPSAGDLAADRAVQEILARNAAAVGSADPNAAVRTRVMKMTVSVSPTGVQSAVTVSEMMPDKMLIDSETAGIGSDLKGYDGRTGWSLSDIQGYRELSPVEIARMRLEADPNAMAGVLQHCPLRRALGRQSVDGRWTQAVALATPAEALGTFYFDETSGLLVRHEGAVVQDASGSLEATVDWGDYRAVDGVLVPFSIVLTSAATQTRCQVESIKDNVPLDPGIFSPRQD